MLAGIRIDIGKEGLVVAADEPFLVVSSAVVGGGVTRARTIVNVHVPKNFSCDDVEGTIAAFARSRGLATPYVGLLTSAWTEKAEAATEAADGVTVVALTTVGLGNTVTAGEAAVAIPVASTINTIIVVDAAPEPAALVNVIITATEVKARALAEAGVRSADGRMATGTSTDAVVVAATGRGRACRYGGPSSELGSAAARAVKSTLDAGIRTWLAENR